MFAARQHFIRRQPVALTLRHRLSGFLQREYELFELLHQWIAHRVWPFSRRRKTARKGEEAQSVRWEHSEELKHAYGAHEDQSGEQAVLDFEGAAAVAEQTQDRAHGFPRHSRGASKANPWLTAR